VAVYKNDANLQALWLLEEVSGARYDDTANNNDLTDNNTVGSSTDAREGSRSADFEAGNGEYLSISDAAQTGLDVTGPLTICCWVKPETVGGVFYLATKYDTSGNQRGYSLYSGGNASGDVTFILSSDGVGYTAAYTAGNVLTAGVWRHVAAVYDGVDMRIYVDGALANNGSNNPKAYTGGIFDSSAAFRLGSRQGGATYYDGLMDEAAVFDRALSAAEVLSIYQYGILAPTATATPGSHPRVRALIGDRTGRILAEVEPEVGPVSWRLNEVGRATLTFAKSDPKAIEDYLRFGNRLLLQFGNGLPDWGGVIDPPRAWDGRRIRVTAYSGEYLLGLRQTGKSRAFSSATVGHVFQTLIQEANALSPTGLTAGSVWGGGSAHSPEYHFDNLLKIIQESLTERLSAADFAVLAAEMSGYVAFTAHLYERRGADKPGVVLLEDHNLAGIGLNEQGPVVNCWDVVGQGTTWGEERPAAHVEDAESVAAFGRREDSQVYSDTAAETTLEETAGNKLVETAWPRNVLTLEAMDLPPARFADYDVGDSVRVMLHSYGFGGYDGLVRVLAREYDPARGVCKLVVQEV
jgi:hypothetical protein